MEIGQAETTEVNKNTNDQEKSIELMRGLFPKNAQIENVGGRDDKEYKIKAKLEDSPFCEGGQEIELKVFVLGLSNLEEIRLEEGWIIDPHVRLKVLSFLVNGEEINDEKDNVIISGYKTPRNENSETLPKDKKIMELDCNISTKDSEACVDIRTRKVILNNMQNGSSLASYLHEKSHILRENDDIDVNEYALASFIYNSGLKMINNQEDLSNIEEFITPEISESFRRVIFEERQADIKSLEFVKQHKKLFPNDPDLSKLKNFYINILSTYFRFQKGIRRDEVVTIMDFDQDWHY